MMPTSPALRTAKRLIQHYGIAAEQAALDIILALEAYPNPEAVSYWREVASLVSTLSRRGRAPGLPRFSLAATVILAKSN